MNKDDFFDELLRNKFNSQEIEFEEAHWNHAKKLIARQEKEKKRRKILFFLFLMLILSGTATLYSIFRIRNLQPALVQLAVKHPETKKTTGNNLVNNDMNFNRKAIAQAGNQSSPQMQSKHRKIEKQSHMLIPLIPGEQAQISEIHITKQAIPEYFTNPASSIDVGLNSESLVEVIPIIYDSIIKTQGGLLNIQDSNKEPLIIVNKDSILQKPSEIAKTKDKKSIQIFNYSIIAGAYLNKAYVNNGKGSGVALNILAGLEGAWYINSHFRFTLNALYFEKGKLNSKKEFYSEYYKGLFEKRTENTIIRSEKLQYMSFPLLLGYCFGKADNQIEGGIGFEYLITSQSEVTHESTVNGISTNSVYHKKGYVNGFNAYDISLQAGYSRQIFRRLYTGARIIYGLKDQTKNEYYQNNVSDQNFGVNIHLKIKIQ